MTVTSHCNNRFCGDSNNPKYTLILSKLVRTTMNFRFRLCDANGLNDFEVLYHMIYDNAIEIFDLRRVLLINYGHHPPSLKCLFTCKLIYFRIK